MPAGVVRALHPIRDTLGRCTYLLFTAHGTFADRPATIALSRVRRHHERPYFAHLVIVWKGRNGKHHRYVLNWVHLKAPGLWLWN